MTGNEENEELKTSLRKKGRREKREMKIRGGEMKTASQREKARRDK